MILLVKAFLNALTTLSDFDWIFLRRTIMGKNKPIIGFILGIIVAVVIFFANIPAWNAQDRCVWPFL